MCVAISFVVVDGRAVSASLLRRQRLSGGPELLYFSFVSMPSPEQLIDWVGEDTVDDGVMECVIATTTHAYIKEVIYPKGGQQRWTKSEEFRSFRGVGEREVQAVFCMLPWMQCYIYIYARPDDFVVVFHFCLAILGLRWRAPYSPSNTATHTYPSTCYPSSGPLKLPKREKEREHSAGVPNEKRVIKSL